MGWETLTIYNMIEHDLTIVFMGCINNNRGALCMNPNISKYFLKRYCAPSVS